LPQLRSAKAVSRDTLSIGNHQDKANMDAYIIQTLPSQPLIPEPALNQTDKTLRRSPEPVIDASEMLGSFHVNPILHRQHINWIHPTLQPPPRDNMH
jgi:hypothetical protein